MAYRELSSFNATEGPHVILQAATDAVPILPGLILFGLFCVALFGSFFTQKRLTGQGNFPASFAVAGYFVTIVAFVMTRIPDIISMWTVAICLIVSVLGTLWFFISEKDRF